MQALKYPLVRTYSMLRSKTAPASRNAAACIPNQGAESQEEAVVDASARAFEFSGRLRSFRHAGAGVATMLRSQHNAWIHAAATVVAVTAGMAVRISGIDWCLLSLAVAVVWVAEALNTAFEFLCDVASPEFHPLVKKSKDVAAGAVLLAAVGAVVVGAIVFIPHLLAQLGR
jgi:diacylglycerol kinase (ATP)